MQTSFNSVRLKHKNITLLDLVKSNYFYTPQNIFLFSSINIYKKKSIIIYRKNSEMKKQKFFLNVYVRRNK